MISSAVNQKYRLVHWHGARGIGDFKIYLGDEDDTRKFMRVFMMGRTRESRLAELESVRLQGSQSAIIEAVRSNRVVSENEE